MKVFSKLLRLVKSDEKAPFCTVIIAAAGSSTRMGGENKILAEIRGVPVLARTLSVFQAADCIHEIIIVTREEDIVPVADICAAYNIEKATKIVCGGAERVDSVLIGVMEASDKAELIAVHDGARPLVTEDIVTETVSKAAKYNAAAPAIPVNDTIKTMKDGVIETTLDRSSLAAVQTPQVFRAEILKAALRNVKKKNIPVTDDCSAVEAIGVSVHLTKGSFENIKITTVTDYSIAEAIIDRRSKR